MSSTQSLDISQAFVEINELAAGVGLTPHTIRQYRSGICHSPILKTLPAPVFTRPRLMWLRADLERWLCGLSTLKAPSLQQHTQGPTKRGRGRPRKCPPAQKGGV